MQEIRIHGRGGQGSVVTAELLAVAAYKSGFYSQAFPYLGGGGERRGAPVQAFCRINREPIYHKCQVLNPDYLIVQDENLLQVINIFQGLKKGGLVLINSLYKPEELSINTRNFIVYTFPATEVALKTLGKPIMNTSMIGAFAGITGLFDFNALTQAVQSKFSSELANKNELALKESYEKIFETGGIKSES